MATSLAFACSNDARAPAPSVSPDAGTAACADCPASFPDAACPAGSAPLPGDRPCTPVGWTAPCLEGFETAASGWGCAPILPASKCTGDTRSKLGQTSCTPVGACD